MRSTIRLIILASACAIPPSWPAFQESTIQAQQAKLDVPPIKQPYMHCLVASVSMVLKYWGREISPDAIGERVSVYKDGTAGKDLARFVEAIGFHGLLIQPTFEDLLMHIAKGRPLIIALPEQGSQRHAMVLTGFDLPAGMVSLNDPASGKSVTRDMAGFRKLWEKGKRWTFLIVPK